MLLSQQRLCCGPVPGAVKPRGAVLVPRVLAPTLPRTHRAIEGGQQRPQQRLQQTGRSGNTTPVVVASAAAASFSAWEQPEPQQPGPRAGGSSASFSLLQRLCRSVLVGCAAAAVWSIAASALTAVATGAPVPLATLSLTAGGASSAGERAFLLWWMRGAYMCSC